MTSYPLEITDLKFFPTEKSDSSVKALCTAVFNESIIVSGIRIKDGKKGIYVSFPVDSSSSGKKWPIVYPASRAARNEISNKILATYVINVSSDD